MSFTSITPSSSSAWALRTLRRKIDALAEEVAQYVRSKNAGPFWVTIDVFCADDISYARLTQARCYPLRVSRPSMD